jgi:Tol biopolymer transport system component
MRRTADGIFHVWVLDARRAASSKLTADLSSFPIWSPDSKRVVFGSLNGHDNRDEYAFYTRSADGNGDTTFLVSVAAGQPSGWSPDGRFFLFQRRHSDSVVSLEALPLTVDGRPAGEPFALAKNTSADDRSARFSPDGRWIAYQSNRSGKNEIYVQPFPGPGPAKQISIGGGSQVRWPKNAKELFYVAPDGKLISVPMAPASDGRTIVLGTPAIVAPNLRVGTGLLRQDYDVSPDGQRILMSATPEDQLTPPIRLILNCHPKP